MGFYFFLFFLCTSPFIYFSSGSSYSFVINAMWTCF